MAHSLVGFDFEPSAMHNLDTTQLLDTVGRVARKRERRRYERYAVRCSCWLERDDASIYGPTADLGLGGLFLRTAVPIEHGGTLDITLCVGGNTTVVAQGVVTRSVRAEHGRRHGVGVEFVQIVEGRDSLWRFLRARPRA